MYEQCLQQTQTRAEHNLSGTFIDLIATAMLKRGYSPSALTENFLVAALAYISGGSPDASHFRRIRDTIDELELLLIRPAKPHSTMLP